MSSNFESPVQITTPLTNLSRDEVKAFRQQLGVSQAALAKILSVTPRTIEVWETPNSVVPAHWRYAFAALKSGLKPWGL